MSLTLADNSAVADTFANHDGDDGVSAPRHAAPAASSTENSVDASIQHLEALLLTRKILIGQNDHSLSK